MNILRQGKNYFKRKLLIAIALLIVLSSVLTGAMSSYIASGIVKDKAFSLSQKSIDKTAQTVDEKLKKILSSIMILTLSEPFNEMVKNVRSTNKEQYYIELFRLQTPIMQMHIQEPGIHSILIDTPKGEFYLTNQTRLTNIPFKDSEAYDRILQSPTHQWLPSHKDYFFRGEEQVISFLMKPTLNQPESEVIIMLNIADSAVKSLIENDFDSKEGTVLLVSKSDEHFFSTSPEYDPIINDERFKKKMKEHTEPYFNLEHNGKQYLVNTSGLELNKDWTLVSIQSMALLLKDIDAIKWTTLIIAVVTVSIGLIVASILTGYLTRPLHKLKKLMKEVGENNLEVRFTSKYRDEIAEVGLMFNRMLERQKQYIDQIKEVEADKRKAEMTALQAQIDPHFLYNTLNTIFWRCMTDQHDDAKVIVIALSKLFELGLNKGVDITSVEKELLHVQQYLEIQQRCYPDLFTYRIECSNQEILQYPIVKILLQPLVENSILHGFKDFERGGELIISVQLDAAFLKMTVIDNGQGMDTEMVYKEMRQALPSKSYALRNVYSRIHLYYGERASLSLQSEPYEQTSVQINIPLDGIE